MGGSEIAALDEKQHLQAGEAGQDDLKEAA
jgi:hypothetical protein